MTFVNFYKDYKISLLFVVVHIVGNSDNDRLILQERTDDMASHHSQLFDAFQICEINILERKNILCSINVIENVADRLMIETSYCET